MVGTSFIFFGLPDHPAADVPCFATAVPTTAQNHQSREINELSELVYYITITRLFSAAKHWENFPSLGNCSVGILRIGPAVAGWHQFHAGA
jgi:hypothetical protein